MKNIYLFALAAISLFVLSSCGKPSHESVREAEIEILEEVAEIFESVEDESSAKAAAKELDKMKERFDELKKQKEALGEMSDEEEAALDEKFAKRQEQAEANCLAAMFKLGPKKELHEILEPSMKVLSDYK